MIEEKKEDPLVSILVPTYNRVKFIEETIESALKQTYWNIEVVVVDNASTDGTWEKICSLASENERIKATRNDNNIGPVRNWIRCVELASGIYGKILWSDDLMDERFIEKTLALFDGSVGFVFTGAS